MPNLMVINDLINMLNTVHPLSVEAEMDIREIFITKTILKNTLLVKEGQIVNKVWYLHSGLLRSFINKDGKEATTWIMVDRFPFTNYRSFITQYPSLDNIVTIEDCVVLETTREKLYAIYDKHPSANTISRKLAEIYFLRHDAHVSNLLFSTAEERLNNFKTQMPDIFERMKLKDIASYLGMTKETLSRLRTKFDDFRN